MIATLAQPKTLTFLEFLELEVKSEVKHEFFKGKTKEMAGGTQRHSALSSKVNAFLIVCTMRKNREYHVFNSDMAIYMEQIDKSVYSDTCVVEGMPWGFNGSSLSIVNPKLIVEVLSPSTQDYDKGDKFEHYQLLASFQEYILVYPNEPKIDIYYRKDPSKNLWMYHQVKGLEASVKCTSIGCTLRLKDLYNNLPPIGA